MCQQTQTYKFFYFVLILFLLSSCRSITPSYNYKELAHAGLILGIDIDQKDNHKLYIESSKWIGTPYRNGGNSKKGIDCSGLTAHIYNKVYHKKIERNCDRQLKKNCYKISKRNLKEGDLVFFRNRNSKKASHVGIYLKNNKFIHASTSKGVIISDLDEYYWKKYWLSGGRIK